MNKCITIGLICLVFFVSLAALSNNPTFSAVQNQNGAVHINLTHQATHIFQTNFFDLSNSQYINTEGNDTVSLLSGIYPALYTFTEDANDAMPAGWTGTLVQVKSTQANHSKIVQITGTYGYMENTCYQRNNGTIEFWAYFDSNTPSVYSLYFETMENQGGNIRSCIEANYYYGVAQRGLYVYNGSASIKLGDFALDSWIHSKYIFNHTTSTYDVYINTTFMGHIFMDYSLKGNWTEIVHFESGYANRAYVDAVDYSWAEGYTEGRNYNNTYATTGSYISPVLDIGLYNNYFVEYINLSYLTPSDSEIAAFAQFSTDNSTWSGWLPLVGLPNVSAGFEAGRYIQFYVNLTASSDFLETPELYSLLVQFEETVLNEVPQLGDIAVAFDNETLEATISVYVTDPDNDTMDIFLCLPLGDIIANQTGVINGTIVQFIVICEYESAYEFYLNVTDSEDSTQSSLIGFTTGAEPEEPPVETPALNVYLILTIALAFLAAFITGGVLLRNGTEDSETREQPKQRRTRFLTLLLAHLLMGCGGRSTYSPSSCLVETGAKNKTSRVV